MGTGTSFLGDKVVSRKARALHGTWRHSITFGHVVLLWLLLQQLRLCVFIVVMVVVVEVVVATAAAVLRMLVLT